MKFDIVPIPPSYEAIKTKKFWLVKQARFPTIQIKFFLDLCSLQFIYVDVV